MAEAVGLLLLAAIPGGTGFAATSVSIAGISLGISTAASVLGSAALLGASIGLSYALAPPAPKQPKPADSLLSIRQPNPVRQGGYGRDRVAGSYMLYHSALVLGLGLSFDVVALVGGEICRYQQFYLNDDAVALSGSTVIGGSDGRYGSGNITIQSRLGLATETAYSDFVSALPGIWTSNHRGDGIASMALRCNQSSDIEHWTAFYPNGLPAPSAVCDLYPIWDPRDPAQDPDNPASWIAAPAYSPSTTYAAGARVTMDRAPFYSYAGGNVGNQPDLNPHKWCAVLQNPILQIINFLTDQDHGMGLDRGILITPGLAALKAKADLCDALVANAAGGQEPRYSSCGKFNFDDDPADILGAMLATCDGWMTEDGDGTLVIEVGVYSAPTVTLASQHIVGFSINYGIADEQVINELTLEFNSPAHGYKSVAGDPWRNEADISQRGIVRPQSLSLKWVQRHSQARRLSKRAMARLAAPRGTVTTTLYGLRALGQRWVSLAYPFLPETGTAAAPVVVELSRGSINFLAATVSFDWTLVDPATIDAWDPDTEEGRAPPAV